MQSPFAGDVGESAATFTGGIALDTTLPMQDGKAVVTAATPIAAIQAALVNTITATVAGNSATYSPDPEAIATNTTAQLPFYISTTPTAGQYILHLEDLALMPGMPPDWDYNDRTWTVVVTELTTISVTTPAPAEESADGSRPVVVELTRANGTAGSLDQPLYLPFTVGGTATPGVDYQLPSSLIAVFWPGESTTKIVLPALPDTETEGPETVIIQIPPTNGVSPGLGDTTVPIHDPGTLPPVPPVPPPSVLPEVWVSGSLDGEERVDGLRPVVFQLSRTNPHAPGEAPPLKVSFSLSGTATVGTDYGTPPTYTATFAPGELTTLVTLGVLTDELNEEFETTGLTVLPSSAYTVMSGSGVGWADIFDPGNMLPTRGLSSVSGTIWLDALPNDMRDPFETTDDDPLADVRVNLLNGSGGLILSTFTDANGHYSFARLPAGDYYVEVKGDILRRFVEKDVGNDAYDSDVGADGRSDPFELDGTTASALQVGAGARNRPDEVYSDPTVEIVHGGQNQNRLQVAKWERAFVVNTEQRNKVELVQPDKDGRDFIDRDSDSFTVRVYDPTVPANQPINVWISTTHPDSARAEYTDLSTRQTLLPVVNQPGWFISDSQMLVSNEVDDKYSQPAAANPNWGIGGIGNAGGIGADDQPPIANTLNSKKINGQVYQFEVSDRTHIVALGGKVRVVYPNALNPVEKDVVVKKTVKLHINVLNVPKPDGGTEPAVANALVEADVKKMREIFAQIGLDMQYSTLPIQVQPPPSEAWRLPPNGPEVVDPPAGAGLNTPDDFPSLKLHGVDDTTTAGKLWHVLSDEQKALLGATNLRTQTQNGKNDVEVYYVLRFSDRTADGLSLPRDFLLPDDQKYADSVVIVRESQTFSTLVARKMVTIVPNYMTLAHEVAHILDPKRNTTQFVKFEESHYPYSAATAESGQRVNLLASGNAMIANGKGYELDPFGDIDLPGGKAVELNTGSGIFDSRRLTRSQEVGDFKSEVVNGQKVVTHTREGMVNGHVDLLHGG